MIVLKTILCVVLAATLLSSSAYAQNPDAPLKGRDSDPALPPAAQTPAERVRPSQDAPPTDQSLSDKLRQNDGVIKPPAHVDPAMRVKPKAPAAMPTPVVKPPANVVPK